LQPLFEREGLRGKRRKRGPGLHEVFTTKQAKRFGANAAVHVSLPSRRKHGTHVLYTVGLRVWRLFLVLVKRRKIRK
jgi:hypothetical protein